MARFCKASTMQGQPLLLGFSTTAAGDTLSMKGSDHRSANLERTWRALQTVTRMALPRAGSGSMTCPQPSSIPRLLPPGPATSVPTFRPKICAVAGAAILVLWGSLYLVFHDWRARYRARTSFGVTQVAPVIDPLAKITPPGVNAGAWQEAVRQTHAMLVAVLSANLLDVRQMQLLREELKQTVERARLHPETARDELASVWTAMADRAEFVLQEGTSGRRKGHPRPAILPPRPVKEKSARPFHEPSAS